MTERRGIVIVTMLAVGIVVTTSGQSPRPGPDIDGGARSAPAVAQWGEVTKGKGTPVPRRTPVAADGQERRGESAERQGSPFGAIRKRGE
jgi:hypothetical protein